MKANKLMRTLAASAMSVALLAGVTALPAMADTGVATGGTLTVNSTLQIPEKVAVPDITLDFQVAPGSAGTYQNMTTYAGIADGVTVTDANYDPEQPGTNVEGTEYYEKTLEVTFNTDASKFSHAGIYVYTVSIADNADEDVTEAGDHTLYVYVRETAAGGAFEVYGLVLTSDGTAKVDNFVSKYLFDGEDPNPGAGTANITVSKQVAGNFGDKTQDFDFTVDVPANLYYEHSDGVTKGLTTAETTFQLSHGESLTIYGVKDGAKYTITEDDWNADNYTSSVQGATNGQEGTIVAGTNVTATYTNTRNADDVAPTGIVMNIAPYALMVVIALAGVVVFMRKRVED